MDGPMNPVVKERWLAALRSDKYIQGDHHLARVKNNELRHCCLGVLCEIAVEEGVADKDTSDDVHYFWGACDRKSGALLPDSVAQWAGTSRSPYVTEVDGGSNALTAMNDMGVSFSDIADRIEVSL